MVQRSMRLGLASRRALLITAALMTSTSVGHAQRTQRTRDIGVYALQDGVIVDRAAGLVYIMMAAADEIDALDVRTGRVRFWTHAAMVPLAASEGRLLAWRESAENELRLIVLSAANGRTRVLCDPIPLPGAGMVTPNAGLGWSFTVRVVRMENSVAVLRWSAARRYVGGAAPTPEMEASVAATSRSGEIAVDIETGHRVEPVPATSVVSPALDPAQSDSWPGLAAPMVVGPFTVSGVDVTVRAESTDAIESVRIERRGHADQRELAPFARSAPQLFAMFSNDREYLMFATAAANEPLPTTVHVYDLVSGRDSPRVNIGDFSPYFVVAAGRVLHMANGRIYSEVLSGGGRRWSRAVRQTSYQGPYPP